MIKLGWMTDDSARSVEKLTEWPDWEYDMLATFWIFICSTMVTAHTLHPQQTHSANLKNVQQSSS